ncbi:hypothetical protein [[Mycoplasma] phocae]|nr:hypothetical protein [[Mycoplasma] phocae]
MFNSEKDQQKKDFDKLFEELKEKLREANFVYNNGTKINSFKDFRIDKINSLSIKNFKVINDKSISIRINDEDVIVKLFFTEENKNEFITYLRFSIKENKFTIISESEFENLLP